MSVSNIPILDLIILPTHNTFHIAIGDASFFPDGWNVSTPTLEVTPPAYPMVSLEFVEGGLQIYNSQTLGIGCNIPTDCQEVELPDGVYEIKYTIYPAYKYFVVKKFLRVEKLYSLLDGAFMSFDLACSTGQKEADRKVIEEIEFYIQGAIAAANKCATDDAMVKYNKAKRMVDTFVNTRCYLQR